MYRYVPDLRSKLSETSEHWLIEIPGFKRLPLLRGRRVRRLANRPGVKMADARPRRRIHPETPLPTRLWLPGGTVASGANGASGECNATCGEVAQRMLRVTTRAMWERRDQRT